MLFPRASGQGLGQIPLSAIKSYELVVFKPLGHVPFPFCPGMSRLASVFPEAISAGAGSAPAMAGVMWGDWIPQLPTGGPKSSGSKGSTSWAAPVPDISVAILGLPRNQGTWIYHLGIKGSGLPFTLEKAEHHWGGSGHGQSEWPVQEPHGPKSHPVPLLRHFQAGFVHLQRALTEAGGGGNICTPVSWQGRLWGSTEWPLGSQQ